MKKLWQTIPKYFRQYAQQRKITMHLEKIYIVHAISRGLLKQKKLPDRWDYLMEDMNVSAESINPANTSPTPIAS